jgi:hypothetical protein
MQLSRIGVVLAGIVTMANEDAVQRRLFVNRDRLKFTSFGGEFTNEKCRKTALKKWRWKKKGGNSTSL